MTDISRPGFCTDLSGYYPVHDYIPGLQTNIGIVLLISGLLNVFMSLVTVLWIRRQRYLAQEETENDEAVNSVIFPVFVRLLWLSVLVNILSGISVILIPLHRAGENTLLTSLLYGFVWAMQHGVLEGVAFLLMQKGCGEHAARRARMWSFWWVSFVFVLMFCSFYYGSIVTTVLSAVRDAVLVMFYFILYAAPEQRLFRRPAALFYSKCWLAYRGFFLLLYIILILTDTEYLGNCGYIILSLFVFAIIQPLIMYTTLLRDSWWWQGVEITARSNRDHESDIRGPLLGSEYSLQSAQALAGTVDAMRVRGNVTMLNFACIKLNSNKTLGAGSFSKVYKGTYRGKDCAIKLIYTIDITAETIKKVAAEASILSSIRHKNIVNILGVSVLPPSVCLILELCSFGSLSDIIRGYGFDWSSSHRAPLRLCYADILYLALGCARGLAAVHSYDRSLCHRDVKSFNFLVDHQFNVKIADLELGIMAGEDGLSSYNVPGRDLYAEEQISRYSEGEIPGYLPPTNPLHTNEETGSLLGRDSHTPLRQISDPECVNVNELLANWLAPEVILERKFRQASDVYALGTVLWEILSGLLPFDGEHPAVIRRKIVSGFTHPIPPAYVDTTVAQLITDCWKFDPKLRPTSKEIAATLEEALHAQCYKCIKNSDPIPDTSVLRNFYDQHYRKSVYGDSSLHKVLFADLRGPSIWDYLNPLNWLRYFYQLYCEPSQRDTPYRAVSVDEIDSEGSFMGEDSSLSESSQANSRRNSGEEQQRKSLPRQLFADLEGVEAGSDIAELSRSSYVMSEDRDKSGLPMYAQLPRAALDVIGVIKEEAYWAALERSGVAWAVTTIDAPYIVMHATSAWYKMFNVPHGMGSYHHMYSIMSLIGRDSTLENATGATLSSMNDINTTSFTSSNSYVKEWKECTPGARNKSTHHNATNALLTDMHEGYRTGNYKEVHGVLCFSRAGKKSDSSPPSVRGSFSTHNSIPEPHGHNLMCSLHIFPIYSSSEDGNSNLNTSATVGSAGQSGSVGACSGTVGGAGIASPGRNGLSSLAYRGSEGSSSTPTGLRPLGAIKREIPLSNLTSSLASLNAAVVQSPTPSLLNQQQQHDSSVLRRSLTQTPSETPSLRRTNTQVSHNSFASSIRTSVKPEGPRPVYYAIQFHELSEASPINVNASATGGVGGASTSAPNLGVNQEGSGHGSGGGGSGGLLSSLIPNIGRFWSSEKNKNSNLGGEKVISGGYASASYSATTSSATVRPSQSLTGISSESLVSSSQSSKGSAIVRVTEGSGESRAVRHSVA